MASGKSNGHKSDDVMWRHVTLKGQGRDPNAVDAYYFENLQQLDIMPHSTERIVGF